MAARRLGLRQTVRHRIQHRRVDGEAAVAADHLDALAVVGRGSTLHCQATMPSERLKMDVVGTDGGSSRCLFSFGSSTPVRSRARRCDNALVARGCRAAGNPA
jgi:hypothetical protein